MKPLFSDIVPFIQSKSTPQNTGNSLLIAMNDVVTYDIISKIAPVTDHSPELTEEQEQELEKEEEDKAIKEKDDIEAAAEEAIKIIETTNANSELIDSMIKPDPLAEPSSLAEGGSKHKKTYKKKYSKKHKKTHKKINKKKNNKKTIKKKNRKNKKVTLRKKNLEIKTILS